MENILRTSFDLTANKKSESVTVPGAPRLDNLEIHIHIVRPKALSRETVAIHLGDRSISKPIWIELDNGNAQVPLASYLDVFDHPLSFISAEAARDMLVEVNIWKVSQSY